MAMSWEDAAVPDGVGAEEVWGQGKLLNKQQLLLRACAGGEPQQGPGPRMGLIPVNSCQGSPSSAAPAEAQSSGFPCWRTQC